MHLENPIDVARGAISIDGSKFEKSVVIEIFFIFFEICLIWKKIKNKCVSKK